MAENVNVTPPPANGGGNGGLYFVVGAILAVVLVGGFLLFGNPNRTGPNVAGPPADRNVNVTIERKAPPAMPAPAPTAPAPTAPTPPRQ